LIERAKTETLAAEPLRERFEKAREQAEDLVYSELDESDQHRIADDEVVPDAAELAGLEARIAKARARDAAHIADQQRRLAMAATLDALQTLGYETSVVDEATWFKNRSMFISRPEWGGYVVRLTPRDGTMVLFAGRYVDEDSWNDATRPLSPEMEAHYRLRIDDWCSSHLPRLERALRNRGIELNVRDVEDDVHEIQPVARQELGDTMADRIQTRIVEQEKAQDALKGARHA
jgi:hypothetical protein